MTHNITLNAETREGRGKGAARKMRRSGRIPAVIYGRGRETEPVTVSSSELEKAFQSMGGDFRSTVVTLEVGGKAVQALIREVQRHPYRPEVEHIDFYEIHAGESVTLEVPIHLVGNPDGVRNGGGVLDQALRAVEIEVLPSDIPEHIDVDVTDLAVGKSLHVSDIRLEHAKVLTDPETTICSVIPPRVEVEEAVAEAEAEGAEPEVIGKGPAGETAEDEQEES